MARNTQSNRKQIEQTSTQAGNQHRLLIKLPRVLELTTLSVSEIYRRIAAGTFPKQVMLGPKSAVWIEAEVLNWLESRITASRMGAN